MKKLIELKLKILAKLILAKYKPEVVGITGSVGKTSAKDAIFAVLKTKYNVRTNIKNYNNEIGLPLTIIGADSPGKNIFGWLSVFLKAGKLILFTNKKYPEILVLEMGIDRPGNMDYLNSIACSDIGVLTYIGTVHAEYFESKKELKNEKAKLIKAIPQKGYSIINYDNEDSRSVIKDSQAKVLSYGLDEQSDLRAVGLQFSYSGKQIADNIKGISFKLGYKGSHTPILVPGVVGINAVYAALAATAVGISKGMNIVKIGAALAKWQGEAGRMRLIKGIKKTTIIDDSYNAEPASMLAALGALRRIQVKDGTRRFAVLGDMLELGRYSELAHEDIGKYAARSKIDKLIVVGERARDIGRGALEMGMKQDNIFEFRGAEQASRFIQDRIRQSDLVLVKGSQGIRMERIVLEIMAEPSRAKELLVRQDKEWVSKQ